MPDRITIRDKAECGYAVLSVNSGPELPAVRELRLALDKALYNFGTALVDLSGLPALTPVWATTLAAALGRHGGWPWAKVGLFSVSPESAALLARTSVVRLVPHWNTEAEAAEGLQQRPSRVRRSASLGAGARAPGRGRAMVTEAGLAWALPLATREAAILVTSELVSNGVQHAGTRLHLTLEAGRASLSILVRDYGGGEPVPRKNLGSDLFRGGLAVVAATARHWGVTTHTDGKTVWARLHVPGPDRPKYR